MRPKKKSKQRRAQNRKRPDKLPGIFGLHPFALAMIEIFRFIAEELHTDNETEKKPSINTRAPFIEDAETNEQNP
jgi:hypothetical protein